MGPYIYLEHWPLAPGFYSRLLWYIDPGTGRRFRVVVNSDDEVKRRHKAGPLINTASVGESVNVKPPNVVGRCHVAIHSIPKGTELLVSYGPQRRLIVP
jgi:hypothetical protein